MSQEFEAAMKWLEGIAPQGMIAALVIRKEITRQRNEALEAAALLADEWATTYQRQLGGGGPAKAIRSIKQNEPAKLSPDGL